MPAATQPLVLNGSYGEGAGALFRTALAVSALTQMPVRIHNIRGATRKPGISHEDLSYLRALEECVQARLTGDDLRSTDLTFVPTRPPRAITTRLDVQEHEKGHQPGNALILAESLLPVLARAGGYSKLLLHGETYNPNTLTFDIFERQTLEVHRRQGIHAYARQMLAGFGFANAGEVSFEVEPSALEPIDLTVRGALTGVVCVVAISELPESVGDRAIHHAHKLAAEAGLPLEAEVITVRARQPGVFASLIAKYENGYGSGSAIGQRGTRMEHVIQQAWDGLMQYMRTPGCVDPYVADQVLLPAVLCPEPSAWTTTAITQRLQTMSWVMKQFFPVHITITGREGEPGQIRVSR